MFSEHLLCTKYRSKLSTLILPGKFLEEEKHYMLPMHSLNSVPKPPRDRVCYAILQMKKNKAQVHMTLEEETQAWDMGR